LYKISYEIFAMGGRDGRHRPERAYRGLKDLILRGEFPPGAKLPHADLARRLRMSSTPIREALARLVQEGYARQVPNVGFFVQEMGLEEAEELYEVREALETFAVAKACRARDDRGLQAVAEALKRYEAELRRPIRKERLLRDREFHLAIARLAGNEWLERTLGAVFDRIIMKRTLEGLVTHRRSVDSLGEHRGIVRLMEKGEPARAVAMMRRHVRRGKEFVLAHLRTLDAVRGVSR
jgi:GntR family transcriptional regulator, rspAB operon transcriptional repressor